MSRERGEKTLCRAPGYGVFHPLIAPHRIRFSRSVGAAAGTDHFIRSESRAAARAGPPRELAGGLISNRSCLGRTAVKGARSGSSAKELRMSNAIRSKIDMVG